MIVNIRGAFGSGKSTIVRKILDRCPDLAPHIVPGRERPMGYFSEGYNLWVPGHYETPCGGCDTITYIYDAYVSIGEHGKAGHDVLFEGTVAQHSTKWALAIHKRYKRDFQILVLTTPLEECIASVNARRADRKKAPLADPASIISEHKAVFSVARKLRETGLHVTEVSREEALDLTLKLLRFP